MHQNVYDHEQSEPEYKKYIFNIAYHFGFRVIFEDDRVLKVEHGEKTVVVTTEEVRRNTLCYNAWLRLKDEYNYRGTHWGSQDA